MRVRDYLDQAMRGPRILWAALTASHLVLLVVLLWQRQHVDASRLPESSVTLMMYVEAASVTLVSFVLPARMYTQSARRRPQEIFRPEPGGGLQLPSRFAHPMKAARHALGMGQTAFILRMALAEAVSLDGFALGFLGSPPQTFLPFFVLGLALAVVRFPTVEKMTAPYEQAHGATFAASDDGPM